MKRRRLELPRRNWHYPLKVARLPIPPPLHIWLLRPLETVPRTGLEPARLSTLAPETHASTNSAIWAKKKSGKRDSNSRPRPWQGRALPTELFPQFLFFISSIRTLLFSKAGAKVLLFFHIHKFFCIFFAFFWIFFCVRARPFLNIILYTRSKIAHFMLYNIFLPICPKIGKNN